ncbi:NAD(P)-dependent oxidoreductase [Candidatus Aquiluna sp. UB-MaderosW2red]|uniref:NAD(P)-dependent oxidoreductase n=1 Tax=Candidatus Aquiluna sp. UB-MaderosW2red TaxID=1855377 RepID=UPI000875B369|nr:NAD(P)-dependent oxidoreductase [Candidatus Aquiluna sp. UB-MaderosW2red]SCX04714.1 3-hydroxyisobutyrate dehydrogenase [Candidatus Aquiluna sp. UB-MaderosW2red]
MFDNQNAVIGFIGLGNMGSGMTKNLQKNGFKLIVHDVRKEAAADLLAAGAVWADTPAEVAAHSDVVITMLPTPKLLDFVAMGPDGILTGMKKDGWWVDMSTSVPEVTERARSFSEELQVHIVDAPVAGMSAGARNGTLQIFVGSTEEEFLALKNVFEGMGDPKKILHVGKAGAGYAVKLMINQLWFSHLVATAEVLAIGVKAGVELDVLVKSLVASPANSNFLEHDVLSVLNHSDYDEGFAIDLACKDLGLSIDLARSVSVPVELSAVVEQIYRRAKSQYGDKAGEMTPIKLYEDLIGQDLRMAIHEDIIGQDLRLAI